MATFKMKIAGQDVTFQSEDDAAKLLKAMARVEEEPEKTSRFARGGGTTPKAFDPLRGTLGFLEEVVQHKGGAHSPAIAAALGCEPRGIGRRLLDINNVLKSFGFKFENVYDNSKRLAEGGRVYVPKHDAAAALDAVKRKAGSG
ncbi:MAG: hypothetical protein IT364_11845 [Candidatus Hydrogenedentes bacterium]|nr:hypothetical protein [Candidatus Hydrogenedentota bacterium]